MKLTVKLDQEKAAQALKELKQEFAPDMSILELATLADVNIHTTKKYFQASHVRTQHYTESFDRLLTAIGADIETFIIHVLTMPDDWREQATD